MKRLGRFANVVECYRGVATSKLRNGRLACNTAPDQDGLNIIPVLIFVRSTIHGGMDPAQFSPVFDLYDKKLRQQCATFQRWASVLKILQKWESSEFLGKTGLKQVGHVHPTMAHLKMAASSVLNGCDACVMTI